EDQLFEQIFVTRTGDDLTTDLFVDYTTVDGTAIAGRDYVATVSDPNVPSTQLFFAANDTTPQSIVVPIIDNHTIDGDRTFSVQLIDTSTTLFFPPTTAADVVLDQVPAVVTIQNNDTGFQFAQADYSATGKATQVTITVE